MSPPLIPWVVELGRSITGLAAAYAPLARAIDPRSREQVVLAVTEVNGCRYTAWVHGAWHEFLGDADADDALDALLDDGRASARAGVPLPTDSLDVTLPPEAVRAVRATVAVAELSTAVGTTADGLAERFTGRRGFEPVDTAREVVLVASALPVAASMFVVAGAMRLATYFSPPMPHVVQPDDDDANLVVAMLAEAVPAYLSNALVRGALLALPRPLIVGVRAEGSTATMRITRDRIELVNGLADDTVMIVDGGLDLLLDVAARAINRELSRLTVRRRS
jgi:alkylhydroperoxidase family enzyme